MMKSSGSPSASRASETDTSTSTGKPLGAQVLTLDLVAFFVAASIFLHVVARLLPVA